MKRDLKRLMSTALVLLGLTAVVPLGAWAQSSKQPADNSGQQKVWAPNQAYVQGEVLHQLRMLPYYTIFDDLSFRLDGNEVVLSGQVVRPTLKSDAEAVTKGVEGVDRVVNKIEVLPTSNFDDRIRIAEYRAIYLRSGFERYAIQSMPPIHIIVKNGNVTLTGVVANEGDKNLVGIRANGVSGVFSVTNNLRIEK
jgi:hyperosmotically inducible protein